MISKLIKVIVIMSLFGNVFLTPNVESSEEQLIRPFVLGKEVVSTPNFITVDEKYVVLHGTSHSTFLDLKTGEVAAPTDYRPYGWSSPSVTESIDGKKKTIWLSKFSSDGNYYLASDDAGLLSEDKGIACVLKYPNNLTTALTIIDVNRHEELWNIILASDPGLRITSIKVFMNTLIVELRCSTYIINLRTGSIMFILNSTDLSKIRNWDDYLFIWPYLIDTKDSKIVYIAGDEDCYLSDGKLYMVPKGQFGIRFTFKVLQIKNMALKTVNLEWPYDEKKYEKNCFFNGLPKGMLMMWNVNENASEIVDTSTKKVIFSHKITATHSNYGRFEYNDNYIVYQDAAQIFCFDINAKKIIWKKEITCSRVKIGKKYYWEPLVDEKKITIGKLLDPQKCLDVYIKDGIPWIQADDDYIFIQNVEVFGKKVSFTKIDWSGKTSKLPEVPEKNQNLYCLFSRNQTIYAWTVKDKKGRLYKLEEAGWTQTFEFKASNLMYSNNLTDYWDKYFAFLIDDNKIGILDLDTGNINSVDAISGCNFWFEGGFLVESLPSNSVVIDLSDFKSIASGITNIIGSDSNVIYFFKNHKICSYGDGKLNETNIECKEEEYGRIGASKGMIQIVDRVYDMNGRYIQNIARLGFGLLRTINDKTYYVNENTRSITVCEIEQRSAFQLIKDGDHVYFHNNGDSTISGLYWLEPYQELSCSKLENPIKLEIAQGQSVEVFTQNNPDEMIIIQSNAFLDQDNSNNDSIVSLENPVFIGHQDWIADNIVTIIRYKQ